MKIRNQNKIKMNKKKKRNKTLIKYHNMKRKYGIMMTLLYIIEKIFLNYSKKNKFQIKNYYFYLNNMQNKNGKIKQQHAI